MSAVLSYQEILDRIDEIDPLAYARTRNHLSGAVTHLSPYISRGIITLPQIRDRLYLKHPPADCALLIQELAWREYFQNVWRHQGDKIFSDLRFPRDDWKHTDLVSVMIDAATGIEAIDQAIKDLYTTGYMHNHARMWTAALATNLAKAHWLFMGKWLYYHLIDGDLASNFLSWQWVAGTSVNKRYTFNQDLINGCSDQPQLSSWLAVPREEFLELTPPPQFLIAEPFTFTTTYPNLDEVSTVSGAKVFLYTPWTLDPNWRREEIDEDCRQILLIDPNWFDDFPVSDAVLDFIIRQGKTVLPGLEVFVGDFIDLPGVENAMAFFKDHPTNLSWQGQRDEPEQLFPNVTDYYQSFFKYWTAVENMYGTAVPRRPLG